MPVMRYLASVKFTLVLIGGALLAVIVGTVIESATDSHGRAAELVYRTPLFIALIASFFVNILLSAVFRWPWRKGHIPFLLAHLGLLMVISGAVIKLVFGVQGNMILKEGCGSDLLLLPNKKAVVLQTKDRVLHQLGHEATRGYLPHVEVERKSHLPLQGEPALICRDGGFGGYDQYCDLPSGRISSPLVQTVRAGPIPTKLEDRRPAIMTQDGVWLAFDPTASDLMWPALGGKARFQPAFKRLPYHVRLHRADILHSPKDYRAEVTIGGKRALLAMNRVFQTKDGYRFYLSSISEGEGAKRVQLVVNQDPAKYSLTYPGGLLTAMGAALFALRKWK